MSSLVDRAIVATLPRLPRTVVGRVASRYLAGERIEQAVAVIREINDRGLPASVAILGESVRSEPDARAMAAEYAELLAVLREQQLRCNVSLKPTAFGLELSAELAHELIDAFCRDAARDGTLVRVEMEHPESITAILDLYSRLRVSHPRIGTVLQSTMRRTLADIAERELPEVRLVKGIYMAGPEIAFTHPDEVRTSFTAGAEQLFAKGARVALATHDDRLIDSSLALIERLAIPRERYEFQVLLGVREELQPRLQRAGHPLRVYVPYGARWYDYSVRRLRENPRIASYAARATLARTFSRLPRALARGGARTPRP